jgi:hypothetical protein
MTSPVFLPIDGMSGFRRTIDSRHANIHDGNAFVATHVIGIGTATAATVLIQTPSTASMTWHLFYEVSSRVAASMSWTLQESPNTTAGTAITPYNCNRQSTITTGCIISHSGAITSAGTILENGAQGVTAAVQLGGTFSNGAREWILKKDTRYVVTANAFTAASSVVINLCWYEKSA